MNLLLSNFNNDDNKDLDELLINYQEYFNFKKINDETYLYLDINHLKNYLNDGKKIKYRKFIFLYLENLINKKKFKNYSLNYNKINNKSLNYILHDKILDNYDIKNIKKVVSLIKYFNKNEMKIKNNNIYSLDDNLYADVKNMKFLNSKFLDDYKFNFKSKGFIINNFSYLKNLITILNCIYNNKNTDKNYDNKIKNSLIKTDCNLVISSKIKIELFINVIKSIDSDIKYLEINNINNLKNIRYIDVLECEYIFINMNMLNNYFKFFEIYYEYNNCKSNINNSIVELLINNNYLNNSLKNIFIYNWNNLIIDNISKINQNDLTYLSEINVNNYNFINYEYDIDETLLKNMSTFIVNNDDLDKYGFNNFKYFIKNELITRNKVERQDNNDEIINIENNEESKIISKLNTKNDEIELARLFIKSNNKYIHKDTEINIEKLIKEKKKNNNILNNIFKTKEYNKSFCCICMDRIDNSKFCILECSHYFCKNCILTHKINEDLNNNENKCPCCRYNYNTIYNIIQDEDNMNLIIKKLENILNKESKNKILIVAEYNQILNYIDESLKNHKVEYYKKNMDNGTNIKMISVNYLKKTIINNINTFIFFTFSEKAYNKYLEIKNLYNDYYLNKSKLNFYIFNYNKN